MEVAQAARYQHVGELSTPVCGTSPGRSILLRFFVDGTQTIDKTKVEVKADNAADQTKETAQNLWKAVALAGYQDVNTVALARCPPTTETVALACRQSTIYEYPRPASFHAMSTTWDIPRRSGRLDDPRLKRQLQTL